MSLGYNFTLGVREANHDSTQWIRGTRCLADTDDEVGTKVVSKSISEQPATKPKFACSSREQKHVTRTNRTLRHMNRYEGRIYHTPSSHRTHPRITIRKVSNANSGTEPLAVVLSLCLPLAGSLEYIRL